MYRDTINTFVETAAAKSAMLKSAPRAFLISSMMAGAYVGLGIILIFSIGSDVDPAYRALVMGASFGIALTLVIFAGSDLFTGHTLFMTLGVLKRRVGMLDLAGTWTASWIGNLIGCALLALVFVTGGGGGMLHSKSQFLMAAASAKMNAAPIELLARAALCNWLVCLAIWMSARMTSDAAKCIAIFWCLFAFIGSGYEHSVANMTLFSVALLGEHPATVSLAGMGYNLFWVTLGNILGGAGFVAIGYWFAAGPISQPKPVAVPIEATAAE
ncbi:MAG TPA: nitrite transporter NirC [Candidatus Cybelea sp.]|nr:nitrite transporter NirC [Candidatus Cybelea sp.]